MVCSPGTYAVSRREAVSEYKVGARSEMFLRIAHAVSQGGVGEELSSPGIQQEAASSARLLGDGLFHKWLLVPEGN